ncbi:MAG TPA: D-amino acid dehydrogenase [Gammaproteobacteria bacterium]|nr:D-amino acid dehydrogenase [Gammaproteobacteria bacterium]
MGRKVLVIGGGLMGVTSAWFLAARGFDVTVVEQREGVALETSFANGGLLTPSQSDPWNAPGTWLYLLRMWREDSPLLLRARALPGMWRWGLKFLAASRAAPWWRATEANLRLGLYSLRVLRELRDSVSLDYPHQDTGTLKIFRDADAFGDSATLARSLVPMGLQHRELAPHEATALEPALAPVADQLVGAIYYPDDGSGDAYLFACALARLAAQAGVQFRHGITVTGFRRGPDGIAAVQTSQGEMTADAYLLAAASASAALAAPLGLRLPIYPVKGYSATLRLPSSQRLSLPLVDFEQKLVVTPLGDRLRIAGTAEFNGFDARPNPRRSAHLIRHAARLLPAISTAAEVENWNGFRPMTADGPPLLGTTHYPNLFLNAGHGPLGWTLCAGSSRAVADLMAGREPEIDLSGYSLARFGR